MDKLSVGGTINHFGNNRITSRSKHTGVMVGALSQAYLTVRLPRGIQLWMRASGLLPGAVIIPERKMKRTPIQSKRRLVGSAGPLILALSLMAGPLAGPATATEPLPTPTPTAGESSNPAPAAPEIALPGTTSTAPSTSSSSPSPSPSATVSPQPAEAAPLPAPVVPLDPGSAAGRAAMAKAAGPGGAEMGQRSARVAGPAGTDQSASQLLTRQSLETQGTWMPTFGVQGLDVSGHQTSVNWQQQWNMGARFAYVKASEGNYYTNELYGSQYQGARNVGMIRGAYHFAIPNWSSGADQARYFVQNGGGWTADGYTLPPVLDFEFNPYEGRTIDGFYFGNTCYGMSPAQLTSWVRDFGNTMQALTGRLPVIYTNTSWWKQCTGDAAGFGSYPLWVAAYPSSATNDAGPVPSSWSSYSMWQYSSTGPFAGDSNVWNGTYQMLQRFATYSDGFGSIFVKGPTSSTVYLVSGKTKYPVPDWATYQLYMNVSSLDQVSQQYLDSLSTGNAVGRFARSPDGSIYLIDSGRKFHVPSCTIMDDFGGGSCTGWIPLADSQLAGYTDAGMLANATVSASGKLFYVSARTKREFFDVASLSRAGLPTAVARLSDAVTDPLPYAAAAPIVRPDVIVVDRVSRQPFINTAGKLLPVPTSINAENAWAPSLTAAALDPQSIAKLSQGPAFTGFASNEAGSARYVIGSSNKFLMTDTTQWPDTAVKFSDVLLNAIGTGPAISSPAFVKSPSTPVVYRRDKSAAREVPDISTLTQLGLGKVPVIYSLSATTLRTLPKGPALLPLAKLVVGNTSPVVYLIDGPDKMLQLEDFRITNSLGIGGYSRIAQSALAPYASAGTVQPVVRCGLDTYLGYGGGIWKLPATTATAQLPARTLEPSTCTALPATRGNLDSTIFVKALDSPVVYLMVDGTKRPVASWTRLVELNNGSSSPVIAEYTRSALDPVPTGSPA